jgi:hypothetical protein
MVNNMFWRKLYITPMFWRLHFGGSISDIAKLLSWRILDRFQTTVAEPASGICVSRVTPPRAAQNLSPCPVTGNRPARHP